MRKKRSRKEGKELKIKIKIERNKHDNKYGGSKNEKGQEL